MSGTFIFAKDLCNSSATLGQRTRNSLRHREPTDVAARVSRDRIVHFQPAGTILTLVSASGHIGLVQCPASREQAG